MQADVEIFASQDGGENRTLDISHNAITEKERGWRSLRELLQMQLRAAQLKGRGTTRRDVQKYASLHSTEPQHLACRLWTVTLTSHDDIVSLHHAEI